jgi:integrase
LNPGSPAPQASVLIRGIQPITGTQGSSKAPNPFQHVINGLNVILDYGPAISEYNNRILKTLETMASNGAKKHTLRNIMYELKMLNRQIDLMNPEAVKTYISEMKTKKGEPASDEYKHKTTFSYDCFAKANGLTWQKPKYTYDPKPPITPTKEQAETIIASAPSSNAATIFRILLEAGFEGEELHSTTEKDIDTEQGIIRVEGHKQHNGRAYKLKQSTAEMLRVYMQTHHREHPFPSPAIMWDSWRTARQRAAAKLSRPDLNKIPLKGLRNLSGILFWQKRPDTWLVMLHMGHKKLSTTQHYLQAMTTMNFDTEWICLTATTKEERIKAIELNATFVEKVDDVSYYRLPKTDENLKALNK